MDTPKATISTTLIGRDAANTTGPKEGNALVEQLTAGLHEAGLPDPVVRVEVVDALPRHPQTGKVQRFVPSS